MQSFGSIELTVEIDYRAAQDSDLQGCYALSLGERLPTFRKDLPVMLTGLFDLQMETPRFFGTLCSTRLTAQRRHIHERSKVVLYVACCSAYRLAYLLYFEALVTKLRKTILSFVMSVLPSTWNNSATTGRIFMKLGI